MEAAKLSNAHGFISALPQGYDTKVCALDVTQPENYRPVASSQI